MYKYKFVSVNVSYIFFGTADAHREVIEAHARKGYRYVGYLPIKKSGHGLYKKVDLIFEKPVKV